MAARVLFVSHTAELNGAERMLLDVLRSIDRRMFRPFLAVPQEGPLADEAETAGVPTTVVAMKWWLTPPKEIWRQPLSWLWNIPGVCRLKRLVESQAIDLVCSNSSAAMGGALAALLARRPHVWLIHEILSGPHPLLRFFAGNRILVRFIRRLSRKVVVNSRASGAVFGSEAGVEIVANGIVPPKNRPAASPRLRRELGLRPRSRVIGVVGKIAPAKGQLEVVEALALLKKRNMAGLQVLFVGEAAEGKYLAALKDRIRSLGLAGDVVFAGFRRDLPAVLPLMDLLLSASRIESFGRAVLEAQACGVPVLAVRTGGIPEIVRHGETGYLVESNAPEILAGAVEDFFSRPRTNRERVVRTARRMVLREFKTESLVRRLERILGEALKETGGEA